MTTAFEKRNTTHASSSHSVRTSSISPADTLPLLTVVIPVFNEHATIVQIINSVANVPFSKEIIVVDDGSTDGTPAQLIRFQTCPGVTIIRHDSNLGKGSAVRSALKVAKGRFLIIQDADTEYSPDDIPGLIEPLSSGEADIVYGSRRVGNTLSPSRWINPFYQGVSVLNFLVWLWYGTRITDEATCYKALSTDLCRRMQLTCTRFEFCPEVTAKACRMGLKIKEIGIHYHPRTRSEGKKITFSDWMIAVRTLWRFRRWSPKIPPQCKPSKAPIVMPEGQSKTTS